MPLALTLARVTCSYANQMEHLLKQLDSAARVYQTHTNDGRCVLIASIVHIAVTLSSVACGYKSVHM